MSGFFAGLLAFIIRLLRAVAVQEAKQATQTMEKVNEAADRIQSRDDALDGLRKRKR